MLQVLWGPLGLTWLGDSGLSFLITMQLRYGPQLQFHFSKWFYSVNQTSGCQALVGGRGGKGAIRGCGGL